jgi:hypothetical protein
MANKLEELPICYKAEAFWTWIQGFADSGFGDSRFEDWGFEDWGLSDSGSVI